MRSKRVEVLDEHRDTRYWISCTMASTSSRWRFRPPKNVGEILMIIGKVFVTPSLGSRVECNLDNTLTSWSRFNNRVGHFKEGHQ